MEKQNSCFSLADIPEDAQIATKFVVDLLFNKIWPLIIKIRRCFRSQGCEEESQNKVVRDVFTLCCSQIKKCICHMFDVFKLEHHQKVYLQESRHCTLERLSWCLNRLISIQNILGNSNGGHIEDEDSEDSLLASPAYFVNWLDHAFEVLTKLSDAVYKTDYQDSPELYEAWKTDLVSYVGELHVCLDELLLSGMTLCKYCLPSDQLIVKARCQVVLRETKALLTEIVTGDPNTVFKVTKESLKLPIIASNVDVLIDVLKDVLYSLETNTNTALLTLVVHCFSASESPVDLLKEHFMKGNKGQCPCRNDSNKDITEDCLFVKEFDLYNERLFQIGSYAVSSSLDQNRILNIRSGLASLEALDPHLVPALQLSPSSHHAQLMMSCWRDELHVIRDSVFLIVDPAAFAEKSKQMIHQKMLDLRKQDSYNNTLVCAIINIGCVVEDFFSVYYNYEPDALIHHDKLLPLLADLKKVQGECKIVSNLLSSDVDFKYDVKNPTNNRGLTFDQVMKRLKLLYTIVKRINSLFQPKDDDDQLFVEEICEVEPTPNNVTHTIFYKTGNTYVKTPQQPVNSTFARTANNGTGLCNNFVLSRLKKHLETKKGEELSFSVQLDELLDNSNNDARESSKKHEFVNKHLKNIEEPSILYNYPSKINRSSLRKAVLNRNYPLPAPCYVSESLADSVVSPNVELMDENMSLQITEILDNMTNMFDESKPSVNSTCTVISVNEPRTETNSTSLNMNKNTSVSKHIWNIPVNTSTVDSSLDETSAASNVSNTSSQPSNVSNTSSQPSNVSNTSSQPSNVTTFERLNDLDLVESKLSMIYLTQETSL